MGARIMEAKMRNLQIWFFDDMREEVRRTIRTVVRARGAITSDELSIILAIAERFDLYAKDLGLPPAQDYPILQAASNDPD